MARARKTNKIQPAVASTEALLDDVVREVLPTYLDGPDRDEMGGISFSTTDLLRLELSQYKVTAAGQAARLKKIDLVEFERQVEAKRKVMSDELTELVAEANKLHVKLQNLQHDIQIAYKLDLKKISYDDATGKITILE